MTPVRAAGLRVGRAFAWIALAGTILGILALYAVPAVARLASPSFTAVPWWWAMAWTTTLLVAVAVCWPPRRWWTPQDAAGRPKLPGLFSTPEWLRGHALIATAASLGLLFTSPSPTVADIFGYVASAAVGLVAAGVATACIRVTAGSIPRALHRGIAQGHDVWLLRSERVRRARSGGARVAAPPSQSARDASARAAARGTLRFLAWCAAILCALPIAVASVVLLVSAPEPGGPFAFLLMLVWVPWGITAALTVLFLATVRAPLEGPRGGARAGMLALLALTALAAAWYLVFATPFFEGFTWGMPVLLVVQALLAIAIGVRMIVGRRPAMSKRSVR